MLALTAAAAVLLGPALLAYSAGVRTPRRAAFAVVAKGRYDTTWLVVTAGGLRRSHDDGRTWQTPRGLPPGAFYTIAADPALSGRAYVANGDVFATSDGGQTWSPLPSAPGPLGPAGITTLAVDSASHLLFAAGTRVLAYDPSSGRWQSWGRGWPQGAQPQALLPVPGHGLYAATGPHLLYAASGAARWRTAATPDQGGAAITALALGPDGQTPYLAVAGRGIWYVDQHGKARHLDGSGLPRNATVYALQSDVTGQNLYAATSRGLFVRHLNATYTVAGFGTTWQPAQTQRRDVITTLRPLRGGLLALGQGGAIDLGRHRQGQMLSWAPSQERVPRDSTPVVAALSGAEWNAPPPPALVPPAFRQGCVSAGPQSGQTYDVCGPFRQVYLQFHQPVFGYPLGLATTVGPDIVQQVFENVVLQWTPRTGVYLLPLGKMAAGGRRFSYPSAQQVQQALQQSDTAYVGHYYVEPQLYSFWRAYVYGGASVFGPPISQFVTEPSTNGSGQVVQVQYFTNARLEYHPSYPPAQQVRVSSLGQAYRSHHGA